jgi:dihydroxyacetone kinase-like protein
MATGLMAMAKALRGETGVPAARVSELVALARDAMQARGKAELGGKTVLDSLDAVAQATAGKDDPAAVADAAAAAADAVMDTFRDRKATVGRARIFAEKSAGMDDPGMLAMNRIVKALANREA